MWKIYNIIRHLIKRGVTKSQQQDGDDFYNIKVSYFDKTVVSEVVYPYGMGASPPINSRSLTFQISGYEENLSSIVYNTQHRWTGLQNGETKYGNPFIGTFIYFAATGEVIITSTQGITINGGNVTVNDGNISAPSGAVADQSGTTPSMQDMRDLFNNHIHPDPLVGFTGVPTTQM